MKNNNKNRINDIEIEYMKAKCFKLDKDEFYSLKKLRKSHDIYNGTVSSKNLVKLFDVLNLPVYTSDDNITEGDIDIVYKNLFEDIKILTIETIREKILNKIYSYNEFLLCAIDNFIENKDIEQLKNETCVAYDTYIEQIYKEIVYISVYIKAWIKRNRQFEDSYTYRLTKLQETIEEIMYTMKSQTLEWIRYVTSHDSTDSTNVDPSSPEIETRLAINSRVVLAIDSVVVPKLTQLLGPAIIEYYKKYDINIEQVYVTRSSIYTKINGVILPLWYTLPNKNRSTLNNKCIPNNENEPKIINFTIHDNLHLMDRTALFSPSLHITLSVYNYRRKLAYVLSNSANNMYDIIEIPFMSEDEDFILDLHMLLDKVSSIRVPVATDMSVVLLGVQKIYNNALAKWNYHSITV